jgi:hypothetical protein
MLRLCAKALADGCIHVDSIFVASYDFPPASPPHLRSTEVLVGRKVRILLVIAVSLVVGAGLGAYALYRAAVQVPDFYAKAIKSDPVAQKKANDEMLQQAANLASDVRRRGQWQATFTAEQINGWLAVDLVKNYPEVLESDVKDPRVAIAPRQATVAAMYKADKQEAVLSINFDVYLSDPNVIAVRILSARAGLLPIPLKRVLDAISEFASDAELPLTWAQNDGDPVALITIPPAYDENDKRLLLEKVELQDGAVFVSGRTDPADASSPVALDGPGAQRLTPDVMRVSLRTAKTAKAERHRYE